MKKYLFLAMITTFALVSCNNKNEAEKSEESQSTEVQETGLRIAYVELDSLMGQYQLYKDYEEIMRCVEPTVEILERIVPIYNFKAN